MTNVTKYFFLFYLFIFSSTSVFITFLQKKVVLLMLTQKHFDQYA